MSSPLIRRLRDWSLGRSAGSKVVGSCLENSCPTPQEGDFVDGPHEDRVDGFEHTITLSFGRERDLSAWVCPLVTIDMTNRYSVSFD